ncbi:hypothetical protein AB9F38_35730, partial [Rhizobium leguminosarum]
GGVRKLVSPMEWHETVYFGGVKLEAFTTSCGLGTMCDTMLGKIDNLDYLAVVQIFVDDALRRPVEGIDQQPGRMLRQGAD